MYNRWSEPLFREFSQVRGLRDLTLATFRFNV